MSYIRYQDREKEQDNKPYVKYADRVREAYESATSAGPTSILDDTEAMEKANAVWRKSQQAGMTQDSIASYPKYISNRLKAGNISASGALQGMMQAGVGKVEQLIDYYKDAPTPNASAGFGDIGLSDEMRQATEKMKNFQPTSKAYDYYGSLAKQAEEKAQSYRDKMKPRNNFEQFTGDLAESLPAMGGAMAMTVAGAPTAGAMLMGGVAGGGEFRQGLQQSNNFSSSFDSGVISGGAEALLSRISLPQISKGIKFSFPTLVKKGVQIAKSVASEALEEGSTEAISMLGRKLTYDKDGTFQWSQVGESAFAGAVMALFFAGLGNGSQIAINSFAKRNVDQNDFVDLAVEMGVITEEQSHDVDAVGTIYNSLRKKQKAEPEKTRQEKEQEKAESKAQDEIAEVTEATKAVQNDYEINKIQKAQEIDEDFEIVINEDYDDILDRLDDFERVIAPSNRRKAGLNKISSIPQEVRDMGTYKQLENAIRRIREGGKETITTRRLREFLKNHKEYSPINTWEELAESLEDKKYSYAKRVIEAVESGAMTINQALHLKVPDSAIYIEEDVNVIMDGDREFIPFKKQPKMKALENFNIENVEADIKVILNTAYENENQIKDAVSLIDAYQSQVQETFGQDIKTGRLKMNLQLFAKAKKELNTRMSDTYGTLYNAKLVHDSGFQPETKAMAEEGLFDYAQHVDAKVRGRAMRNVEADRAGAFTDFLGSENFKTDYDVAVAHELIRLAINEEDFDTYRILVQSYAMKTHRAGQAFRAMQWITTMDREGAVIYAHRQINNKKSLKNLSDAEKIIADILASDLSHAEKNKRIQDYFGEHLNVGARLSKSQFIQKLIDDMESGKLNKEWLHKHLALIFGVKSMTDAETKLFFEHLDNIKVMENGKEKDREIARALKIISDNMDATNSEKVKALMRMAMLGNAVSNVRNVGGNALLAPAEFASEMLALPWDAIAKLATGHKTGNIYHLKDFTAGNKAFYNAVKDNFYDYMHRINTRKDMGQFQIRPQKYWNEESSFKPYAYLAKALNEVSRFVDALMSGGDRPFFEAHVAIEMSRLSRIPEYAKDSGKLESQAILSAEHRTLQNRSKIAEITVNSRNAAGLVGDFIMPFAFTPANIADKFFDYSPLGLTRAVLKNLVYDNIAKNKTFDQREFSMRMGRTSVGFGIIMSGFYLAEMGIITGSYDDDKRVKEFQRGIGIQDFAFHIGDKQFAFDWALPMSVELAIGARMYQLGLSENDARRTLFDRGMDAILASGNIIYDQSFFKGVTDLLRGYGNETLMQNITNKALQSPTMMIPLFSLGRQLRRVTDPNIRNIDYNNTFQVIGNQIMGLSEQYPVKYTPLGENSVYSEGGVGGFLESMLSPASITDVDFTPLEESVMKVYEEYRDEDGNRDNDIFPHNPPKALNDISLSKEEESWFTQTQGLFYSGYMARYDPVVYDQWESKQLHKVFVDVSQQAYDYTYKQLKLRRKIGAEEYDSFERRRYTPTTDN